jgi:hypothetical protein
VASEVPGAVRASAGISTSPADVRRLLDAVAAVATTEPPAEYERDPVTGDYRPARLSCPTRPPSEPPGTGGISSPISSPKRA